MLELVDKYFFQSRHRMKIYIPIYLFLWGFVVLPHVSQTIRAILPKYVQTLYVGGRQIEDELATDQQLNNYLVQQALIDKQRIQDELNRFTGIRKKRRLTKSEEEEEEKLVQEMRVVEQRLQKLKTMRTSGPDSQPASSQSPAPVNQFSPIASQSSPVATPTVSTDIGDKNLDGGGGRAPSESAPSGTNHPPQPSPSLSPSPMKQPISAGVVNSRAISLPAPTYPSNAKAAHVFGQVVVEVLIDENGSVVSARATSGHTLLRTVAEEAARSAKFSPTTLSGQPVKVSGVINYNFVQP